MPAEIDFCGGTRGQFYRSGAMRVSLPVYLEADVQNHLLRIANAHGIDFSTLINALLRKDIEIIETAG